jgi:hypothetical protein
MLHVSGRLHKLSFLRYECSVTPRHPIDVVNGGEKSEQHAAGSTTDQMIAQCKPKIINTFPDWQHPELLDLQIRYNASLLTERREGL